MTQSEKYMGLKTIKTVMQEADKIHVFEHIRVKRPIVYQSGSVSYEMVDAVVLEKYPHHFMVEDLKPYGVGKHKRRWCVSYKDLVCVNTLLKDLLED